jgi:hypothetical protein
MSSAASTGVRPQMPRLATLAFAGSILLAACGGDDDQAAAGNGAELSSGRDRTSGTEPAADDPEAVRPFVEDLLERYDEVTDQIVADPGVAADRDDLLVQEYLALFEPDSDYAEHRLEAWAANGEAGVSMRPIDDEHLTNESHLDGEIEAVSDDEVRFPTCDEQRFEVLDRQGRVTQRTDLFVQPGEGVAVRVDGEWRLRRLDAFDGTAGCRTGDTPTTGDEGG